MKRAESKRVVLVGTYKGDQLIKWRGWYNYPLGNGEWGTGNGRAGAPRTPTVGRDDSTMPQSPADFSQINEPWLFKGTEEQRTYKAEFVGIKKREVNLGEIPFGDITKYETKDAIPDGKVAA